MEVWRYGGMEVWRYGGVEVWRYGGMEVWRYGGTQRSVVLVRDQTNSNKVASI